MEKKYNCVPCQYSTNDKSDYNRHLLTEKHKRGMGKGKPDSSKIFFCHCGKSYKYRSGFSRHKKHCNQYKHKSNIENIESKKDLKIKSLGEIINLLTEKSKLIKNQEETINLLIEKNELLIEKLDLTA